MGFANYRELAQAELDGKSQYSTWRKTATASTAAGIWFDLSMSPGNPTPNYYAASPLVAQRLSQSADGGIYHGGHPASGSKHLKQMLVMSVSAGAVPMPLLLCDYLLYYPFIDMGVTDPQLLTNSLALSRYSDGAGVQIMAVEVAGQSGVGNPQFQVSYTNQDGVTGRVTPAVACNTQVSTGTIISSAAATRFSSGPFLPLQSGDTGVRKIDSVQFLQPDIGLIALVLVKPLATHALRGIDAPSERDYAIDFTVMPQIEDDAYLNLICYPAGNLNNAPLHGSMTFLWN
jgi:hypothetical protein